MTRTDLKRALTTVAETDRPAGDPADDLARARAASSDRARRRFRTGLSGLAVVAVVGVGAAVLQSEPSPTPDTGAPTSPTMRNGVQLVAKVFDATPYTFDLTPQGWSVQGQQPQAVTVAPDDGSASDDPNDFQGKLVIMFDGNPLGGGKAVALDGRTFLVRGDSGYTTVSTLTAAGEPGGVVRIQYPSDTGWDETSMVAFLASVHVGPLAQQGLG